jgi:hypothetical protein
MEALINTLKEEDGRIGNSLHFVVGVPHGDKMMGPASYEHKKDPELIDKLNYGSMLTGLEPQPVVTVTDEDVAIMEQKAWMAKLKDFNAWVGLVYKPEESPANKDLLSRIYPEWIEMQKKEIDNWHDFKKREETVKLKGPDGVEDLFLMYRMGFPGGVPGDASDQRQIKDEALEKSMKTPNAPHYGPRTDAWVDPENFQRGIFNQRRAYLTTQALQAGVLNKRADAEGILTPPLSLGMGPSNRLTTGWPRGKKVGQ